MRRPISWIPTLYFSEGLPYVIVMTISVIMYKRLGLSNTDITLYTTWLYLPWVIKPLWSPFIEQMRTKRWWILLMQLLVGAAMGGVALSLQAPGYVQWSLCFFWLMAFSSATHDISADGFYMLALSEHDQAFYVGIRSTFYRISMIIGQGVLIMGAGLLEIYTRNPRTAWSLTLMVAAATMLLLFLYHRWALPHPDEKRSSGSALGANAILHEVWDICHDFCLKPQVITAVIFMLIYRLPEAMLVKITPLFMLDSTAQGGLSLTTSELGWVQGTVGAIGLIAGGILGGWAIARDGFRRWLWPMVLAMSLPNILYIVLAYYQPEQMWFFSSSFVVDKIWIVAISYFIEQFGYGFGFTAYMMYMLFFSQGNSPAAHYSFCTGLMAASMMLPGYATGWLQEQLGYYQYFVFVAALIPVTFVAASLINVPDDFGAKKVVTKGHTRKS